jgi:hypothetical protein
MTDRVNTLHGAIAVPARASDDGGGASTPWFEKFPEEIWLCKRFAAVRVSRPRNPRELRRRICLGSQPWHPSLRNTFPSTRQIHFAQMKTESSSPLLLHSLHSPSHLSPTHPLSFADTSTIMSTQIVTSNSLMEQLL